MMIEAPALAVVLTLQPEAEVTDCKWLYLIDWPGGGAPRAATSKSAQAAPNRRVHFKDQARPPKSLPVDGTRAG
jgi:hypothetical protein